MELELLGRWWTAVVEIYKSFITSEYVWYRTVL